MGYTQHKVRGENKVGDFRGITMYMVHQTMRSQGEREGGAVSQGQNLGPHWCLGGGWRRRQLGRRSGRNGQGGRRPTGEWGPGGQGGEV